MLDSICMACPKCGSLKSLYFSLDTGREIDFVSKKPHFVSVNINCISCGYTVSRDVHVQCMYMMLKVAGYTGYTVFDASGRVSKVHPSRWKAWRLTDEISDSEIERRYERILSVLSVNWPDNFMANSSEVAFRSSAHRLWQAFCCAAIESTSKKVYSRAIYLILLGALAQPHGEACH